MRLLLDEMISPAIARGLRERGHDVLAVKKDRSELESLLDIVLVRRMTAEQRAVVTNNIADFQAIHNQLMAQGDEHYGMLFTHDATPPRRKADVGLWVSTLADFLEAHSDPDACRNRVIHLP